MRPGSPAFFLTMLMMLALVTAGCSSLPFPGPTQSAPDKKVDVGLSPVTVVPLHETYSFGTVKDWLNNPIFPEDNATAGTVADRQILYVRGMQLDDRGNADTWIFIVRHGNATSLVTYDQYGEKITGTNTSFQGQAIPLDRILEPAELVTRSHAVIFPDLQNATSGSLQLELAGTNYTLTISRDTRIQTLKFDAMTGALTGSND